MHAFYFSHGPASTKDTAVKLRKKPKLLVAPVANLGPQSGCQAKQNKTKQNKSLKAVVKALAS